MENDIGNFFKKNLEEKDKKNEDDEELSDELEEMKKQNEKEEEDKKQFIENLSLVDERLKDYQKAFNYFHSNNLHRQMGIAEKCIKIIELLKKKLNDGKENGKWKEVNLSSLPEEITPEFIYGCSHEERDSKFNEIIKYRENKVIEVDLEINKIKNFKSKKKNFEKIGKNKRVI